MSAAEEMRPTSLVFANACRPDMGSEPGAGWGMVMAINEVAHPIVLTRPDNMEAIDTWLRSADGDAPEFVAVGEPWWGPRVRANRFGAFAAYLAWLRRAEMAAADLIASRPVDVVHHVTYSPYWLPAPVSRFGIPSIWGPVGGAVTTPPALVSYLGPTGRVAEELDRWSVRMAAHLPATRRTWADASLRVLQNEETHRAVADGTHRRSVVFNHALTHRFDPPASPKVVDQDTYALWLSPLDSRKGPELAIRSVAACTDVVRLLIAGDGPERTRMEALVGDLGLGDRVEFLGRVDHDRALALVGEAAVCVFTGLREEGGLALTEALYSGTPTIVLDHGGPAAIARSVSDMSRIALIDVTSASGALADIAAALERFCGDPVEDRSPMLDRSSIIDQVAAMYQSVNPGSFGDPDTPHLLQPAAQPSDDQRVPELSVVMPAFNAGRFIGEAMQSVLDQTLTDLELIVIDNGSTDETSTIVGQYAERDPRIRVYQHEHNVGIARALDLGVNMAKADLIGRLDADDVAFPDRFERQIAFLDANPHVVVVGSNAIHITETGTQLGLSIAGPPDVETFERMRAAGEITMVLDGTAVMRRADVLAVGSYDPMFTAAPEVDLHCRLAERGAVVAIGDPLIYYRLHGGSNVHATFFEGRRIHRYIAYRQGRLAAGSEPITYPEFLAEERTAPAARRLRIRFNDRAHAEYRFAGIGIAEGDKISAAGHLTRAFLANPKFVVERVWNRRLSRSARTALHSSELRRP